MVSAYAAADEIKKKARSVEIERFFVMLGSSRPYATGRLNVPQALTRMTVSGLAPIFSAATKSLIKGA